MSTKVILLGTGNPDPDPRRSGPSVAIVVDGEAYIVDAGPGIVRRAAGAYEKGIDALRPKNLKRLFLTHLHSDHTIGLPDLMFTPWVMERKEPLEVYGPEGTRDMVKHLTSAYEEDINIRKNGLERANDIGWRSIVKEIGAGPIYKDENVLVAAFAVHHGKWKHAFGFRFVTDDGTIVISGDCSPTPDLIEHYRGADILVHEVYCLKGFRKRSEHWKAYHASSHTSSTELGEIASRVRPGKLALYHTLLWGASGQDLTEEISRIYDGEVIFGNDLDIITI